MMKTLTTLLTAAFYLLAAASAHAGFVINSYSLGAPPPTYISAASGNLTSGTSSSIGNTIAGGTDMIVVLLEYRDNPSTTTVSTITYNSVSLTSAIGINSGAGDGVSSRIYYLAAPASGAQTLSITFSAGITSGRYQIVHLSGAGSVNASNSAYSASSTHKNLSVTSTLPAIFLWSFAVTASGVSPAITGDSTTIESGDSSGTATGYAAGYHTLTVAGTASITGTVSSAQENTLAGVAIAGL